MRTTITIDDDVAAGLERLRRARNGTFKDLVNEALRRGIKEMTAREPFCTRVVDVGAVLIPVENISEALAIAEGDAFK